MYWGEVKVYSALGLSNFLLSSPQAPPSDVEKPGSVLVSKFVGLIVLSISGLHGQCQSIGPS